MTIMKVKVSYPGCIAKARDDSAQIHKTGIVSKILIRIH